MAEITSKMLELLECTVCLETMYPPIYQCPNGHGICSTCKLKVNNKCPTCTKELGDIRCLMLENLLATMSLHCQYQTKGCEELIGYDSKAKHEDSCRFRPYSCPSTLSCSFKGEISSLVDHMRSAHNLTFKITPMISDVLCQRRVQLGLLKADKDIYINGSVYQYMGDHFFFQMLRFPRTNFFGLVLRFMGEEVEAKKYRYNLEVIDKHDKTKRMIWVGVPKSIREETEEIYESAELMIIHEKTLTVFGQSSARSMYLWTLSVEGFIWKEDEYEVLESPYDFRNYMERSTD